MGTTTSKVGAKVNLNLNPGQLCLSAVCDVLSSSVKLRASIKDFSKCKSHHRPILEYLYFRILLFQILKKVIRKSLL